MAKQTTEIRNLWQATFDVENAMQHLSTYRDVNDEKSEAVWRVLQESWTALLGEITKEVGSERPKEWVL